MTRIFAKIVGLPEGYGLNLLKFDFRAKRVEQIPLGHGGQEAAFTDFRYSEHDHRLTFVVGGKIEEFPIYEISEQTFETMRRPDNWANLEHGLKIKSPKTVEWLKKRGIYG